MLPALEPDSNPKMKKNMNIQELSPIKKHWTSFDNVKVFMEKPEGVDKIFFKYLKVIFINNLNAKLLLRVIFLNYKNRTNTF